jgi:hypothetical protein
VASWATVLPGYYALGDAPPTRAQLALATYLVVATAILGVALGGFLRGRHPTTVALATALVVAIVFQRERGALIPDIAAARIYARAYDARMATLADASARTQNALLVLDPLPPSGLLRSAEITPDAPFAFANRCLARAAGLHTGLVRASPPVAQSTRCPTVLASHSCFTVPALKPAVVNPLELRPSAAVVPSPV